MLELRLEEFKAEFNWLSTAVRESERSHACVAYYYYCSLKRASLGQLKQDLVVQLFSEDFVTHIALPLTFLHCNELYCGGNRLLHQGAEESF